MGPHVPNPQNNCNICIIANGCLGLVPKAKHIL